MSVIEKQLKTVAVHRYYLSEPLKHTHTESTLSQLTVAVQRYYLSEPLKHTHTESTVVLLKTVVVRRYYLSEPLKHTHSESTVVLNHCSTEVLPQ